MKRTLLGAAIISIFSIYLVGCAGLPPNIAIPKTAPNPAPITKQPRVAIVLGGGGAKGFAHIGVLEVLQKAGVPIDMVSGASAGSIVGALYADNGNADEAKAALMHAGFLDVADVGNLPSLQGPIEGYRVQKFLLEHMRARTFKQTKIPFIVATTDLTSGKLYPIHSGPIAPAVLASAAMPGAIRPPHLYGHTLVDGCMVDTVPVDLVKRYHPKVIIAVNIDQMLSKHMPWSFMGIYDRAYLISWHQLTRYTERDADVKIRPQVGTVGAFDWGAKQRMYDAGVAAGKKALPQILKLLKEKGIPLNPPKK